MQTWDWHNQSSQFASTKNGNPTPVEAMLVVVHAVHLSDDGHVRGVCRQSPTRREKRRAVHQVGSIYFTCRFELVPTDGQSFLGIMVTLTMSCISWCENTALLNLDARKAEKSQKIRSICSDQSEKGENNFHCHAIPELVRSTEILGRNFLSSFSLDLTFHTSTTTTTTMTAYYSMMLMFYTLHIDPTTFLTLIPYLLLSSRLYEDPSFILFKSCLSSDPDSSMHPSILSEHPRSHLHRYQFLPLP